MSTTVQKIRNVLRHGLIVQTALDILHKLGIEISPFYLVKEGLFGPEFRPPEPDLEELEISRFGPEEFEAVGKIPGNQDSESRLLELSAGGNECYGLKSRGAIVGYMWVAPSVCQYRGLRFPLAEDEAYLFNMVIVREYRGGNAAPYLRYGCMKELARKGRTTCISISTYFNAPAIRFKAKLGAKIDRLYLHVDFFGRWNRTWKMKDYAN